MLPRGAAAFRHRNYRLFWSGQLVSLIGTWMQTVGQAWLVLLLTSDPFALGVVSAAQFLPVLLFGLFGGVIADQVSKRRLLMATQSTALVLALVLGVLTLLRVVEVWQVVALALLLGLANAVDMPTRQAFVIEMVGRSEVGNAVALNSAVFNAARIVGPAVAGIVIGLATSATGSATTGTAVCFFLNAASFLAVIGSLLAMRESELYAVNRVAMPRSFRGVVDTLAEGLRYVRRTPIVRLAVSVVGLVSLFGMNFNVLVPAMAHGTLEVGASGFGFLMTALGLGSLTSALSLAVLGRAQVRMLLGGALLLGLLEMAFAEIRLFPLSLLTLFGVGIGTIAMTATGNTMIQLVVPDALRGRVMSVYTTVFAGSTPVGALIAGALASAFGTPVALLAGGGAAALTALVAIAAVMRGGLRADLPRPPLEESTPA